MSAQSAGRLRNLVTGGAIWFVNCLAGVGWPILMTEDFVRVVKHLLGRPNVSVKEGSRISDALAWHGDGLDCAAALQLLASSHCTEFMTFDDRRLARRAGRMGLVPAVVVPPRKR